MPLGQGAPQPAPYSPGRPPTPLPGGFRAPIEPQPSKQGPLWTSRPQPLPPGRHRDPEVLSAERQLKFWGLAGTFFGHPGASRGQYRAPWGPARRILRNQGIEYATNDPKISRQMTDVRGRHSNMSLSVPNLDQGNVSLNLSHPQFVVQNY